MIRRLGLIRLAFSFGSEPSWAATEISPYLGGVDRGQSNISLLNIYRLAESLSLQPAALFEAD